MTTTSQMSVFDEEGRRYVPFEEAGARTGVSVETIRRRCREGAVRTVRWAGRVWLDAVDVERLAR